MANNAETGELLSSPISATFSTIVTKASLVEIPPTEGPINEKSITTLYDEVFVDAMSYRAFTENKLRPWENTLEYKHFNTMYTNHWSLVNTRQEIKTHVSKITRAKLCKRLHKPTQFCFKEMPVPPPTSSILITKFVCSLTLYLLHAIGRTHEVLWM